MRLPLRIIRRCLSEILQQIIALLVETNDIIVGEIGGSHTPDFPVTYPRHDDPLLGTLERALLVERREGEVVPLLFGVNEGVAVVGEQFGVSAAEFGGDEETG